MMGYDYFSFPPDIFEKETPKSPYQKKKKCKHSSAKKGHRAKLKAKNRAKRKMRK